MKTIVIRGDVSRRRAVRYAPAGDQFDAIAKGFAALQAQGLQLPPETQTWLDGITAVKTSLPKRGKT